MLSRWQKVFLFLFIFFLPTQLAYHFWPSFSVINGTRIDYLSPTIYLTDILLIILVILDFPTLKPLSHCGASSPRIGEQIINKIKISSPFSRGGGRIRLGRKGFGVSILVLVNLLFSLHPLLTYYWYIKIFLLSLFVFHYSRKTDFSRFVMAAIPYSLVPVIILAFWQFFLKHSVGGLWYFLGERPLSLSLLNVAKVSLGNFGIFLRPYATFPHPNALAGYLLVCYVLLIKKNKLLLFLISLTIFLTFSRTVIFVFILLNLLRFLRRKSSFLIPLLIIPFLLPGNPFSLSERLSQFPNSLFIIKSHLLFGTGLGNYVAALPAYPFQPIHNLYLLLITELGLPFSLILLFSIFIELGKITRDTLSKVEGRWALPLLSILLTGLSDHYWISSHQNLFLVFLVTAISYNRYHAKTNSNLH